MIFLSACFSPQPIIRLEPSVSENVFWHEGQPIAEAKKDNIVARAAFSHFSDQYYIFDVEVFNEGEHTFLVNPATMSITNSGNYKFPAMDPEKVIFSMEMEASKQAARQKKIAIAAAVLVVGTAIAVAVSGSDGANDDIYYYDYDDDYADYYDDDQNAVVDLVLPSISWGVDFHNQAVLSTMINTIPFASEMDFWTGAALRKTTLRSGESIRGLVAFPRQNTANLWLTIPLNNANFEFLFNQKAYRP